jgi:hypothetical protein
VTGGPWRILVLDRNPQDPMWVIATVAVATPADMRPAHLAVDEVSAIRPAHLIAVDEVTAGWVASASGLYHPAFTPLRHPGVWRIGEGGQR